MSDGAPTIETYKTERSYSSSNRSGDWINDIVSMHRKYGVNKWMETASEEDKRTFLRFRLDFLREELEETEDAFVQGDAEEILDGLIDLCVIAIGTMDAFDMDARGAWDEVFKANMAKEVGVKPSRPNPLGLPDLIKPEGWTGPDHSDKAGQLYSVFETESKLKW